MQQIYWRTPNVISIKLLYNFVEIALQHGCSPVNLLHIFRTPFPKNTSVRLPLSTERQRPWLKKGKLYQNVTGSRKQPPDVFFKKRCHQKFHKTHKKTLAPESLFHKVAGLRLATLLKNRLWLKCFPVNFTDFLRNLFQRTPLGDCFCGRN